VLEAVRESIPRETVVTTDIGGLRLWSMQAFEAYERERFVTAGSWAGMGVGLPAAVGAALANPAAPVLSLHGDGGLLMCLQELHTAVEKRPRRHGGRLEQRGLRDHQQVAGDSRIHRRPPLRLGLAGVRGDSRGFRCRATSVDSAPALREAVTAAVGRDGPDLIDVAVATDEPSAVQAADYDSTVELP